MSVRENLRWVAVTGLFVAAACASSDDDLYDDAFDDALGPLALPAFADEADEKVAVLSLSDDYLEHRLEVEDRGFDLCDPAVGSAGASSMLPMRDAKWMAALSANEYAHVAHLAPHLDRLGFGKSGDGSLWQDRAVYLEILKAYERLDEPSFAQRAGDLGDEIREFVEQRRQREGFLGVAELEALWFEKPQPSMPVQFFSAAVDDDDEQSGSAQVVWARHRTRQLVVIAFRGSQEDLDTGRNPDWRVNFDTELVPWVADDETWGRAHRGFNSALQQIWPAVKERIRAEVEEEDGEIEFIITGHSLGGAMATLAGADILRANREDDLGARLRSIHTFGSPRAADAVFAEKFTATAEEDGVATFRFRYEDDQVTKLPPTGWGYAHVGRLALLRGPREHRSLRFEDGDDFAPEYLRSESGVEPRLGLGDLEVSVFACQTTTNCDGMHRIGASYHGSLKELTAAQSACHVPLQSP